MPDSLQVHLHFTGVAISGAFLDQTVVLQRRCPSVYLFRQSGVVIAADYISDEIDLGGGYSARFTKQGSAFWIVFGMDDGKTPAIARSFKIYEGFPVIKFTNALSACSPKVNISDFWPSGVPEIDAPITDSWTSISSQIVSSGMAISCETEWVESLPNGWDIATLVPVSDTAQLAIQYKSDNFCNPVDLNAAFAFSYNSRVVNGKVVFVKSLEACPGVFSDSLAFEYDSSYGLSIRYFPGPVASFGTPSGTTVYQKYQPTSFLHGNAPYAAVATNKLVDVGVLPDPLTSLEMYSRVLAIDEPLTHPRSFQEAINATPCSDCGTITVTPTLPYRDDIQFPEAKYDVAAHTATISDCPKTSQSMAMAFYASGSSDHAKRLFDNLGPGGVYNSGELGEATILAETTYNKWLLSLQAAQTSPFRLSVDGQQTGNIPATSDVVAVQSAIVSLGNVFDGDVLCEGGPLPSSPITVTFLAQLAAPHTPVFSGSNATVRLIRTEKEFAHFRTTVRPADDPPNDPIDTNYPSDPINQATWNVLEYAGSSGMFQDSTDPDNHVYGFIDRIENSFLKFADGATAQRSNCNKVYLNIPYESVVATVKDVVYDAGVVNDIFWPNDLINGATAPIETTGAVAAPGSFEIGPTSSTSQTYSAQQGGADGLVYRGIGCNPLYGGRYLSASGDAFSQSLILFSGSQPLTGSVYSFNLTDPGVSTSTEFDRLEAGMNQCGIGVGFTSYTHHAKQNGPQYSVFPTNYLFMEQHPDSGTGIATHPGTVGGVLGTNNADAADPIYKQFGNPGGTITGPFGTCDVALNCFDGVKDGPFTEIEFNGYQILSSTTSIDPCNARVTTTINYRVFWIKRVPVDSSGSFASGSPPFTYTRNGFFQYGFADNHVAAFGSNVSTDLALRPNLEKDRVITLDFESDVITGRGYLAPDLVGSASRTLTTMPTSLAWSGFVAYMTSMPYSGFTGLTSPVSTIGSMPWPGGVAAPVVIDFSGASVDVVLKANFGAHGIINCANAFYYTLPLDFPANWQGEHELLTDANEPQWVEESSVAPFVKAMLSSYDWTLTLFEADCSEEVITQVVPFAGFPGLRREPRRVVARYRLPCSQCKRFDCNDSNVFELVSCDRSVADWPFYLEIRP